MGKTVVLVGFSCSGKSTVGEEIEKKFLTNIDILDSDKMISAKYGSDIAEIFLNHEREDAVALIEGEERKILDEIHPKGNPCLVVAGPNLVLRDPQWEDFLARNNPVVFYLQVSPKMCYDRLKGRHDTYVKKYANHPRRDRIGSWNKGILCDVDEHGEYQDFLREDALKLIPVLMREQVLRYEKISDPMRTIDCIRLQKKKAERQAFFDKISDALLG